MKELVRTNDPVRISWLTAVLADGGIEAIVLDNHTSILEGQIGAIPRRIMVVDEDFLAAKGLLASAERELNADATSDALLDGRVLLQQPVEGYRVAIDPVLLAASIAGEAGQHILDVGSGVGAASLCCAWRLSETAVTGLEIQAPLVELAQSNAERNGFGTAVSFFCGDLLRPPSGVNIGGFDHVLANPPYLPADRADPRTGDAKARSHIEGEAGLADWIAFCLRAVRVGGTVTFIHRADRLDEILASLHGRSGEIVVFPIWPRREVSPKRVIVRARRGSKAPLRISPGLVLHEDGDAYTTMAADILLNGAAIEL